MDTDIKIEKIHQLITAWEAQIKRREELILNPRFSEENKLVMRGEVQALKGAISYIKEFILNQKKEILK